MTDTLPPRSKTRDHSRRLRRTVAASTVGSIIEWYDFMLYGTVAALVFPTQFFPSSDPFAATMLTFSTFFVGFAARPIGAIVFGHLGDRAGRKAALISTLVLMGIGTVGVGLIPGYDSIGFWAPVLLVLMRALQGIGMGGEWGGAVLMAAESGDSRRRGFRIGFPQASAMFGVAMANTVVLVVGNVAGDAFVSWAWRLPFLASIVLVVLGFWMRKGIVETADFAVVKEAGTVHRAPVLSALRSHPWEITLGLFLKVGEMAAVFVFITFVFSYGTSVGKFDRELLLALVAGAAIISSLITPLMGALGDAFGPRRVYLVGAAGMAVICVVYFAAIKSGNPAAAAPVILVSLVPYAAMFASEASLITGLFPAQVRYSGSSLAFNLAGIIGGGPAPLIATAIAGRFDSPFALSAYLLVTVGLGVTAVILLGRREASRV
ncbi:MFS transporter [Streptomyces sp. NL15-2K]|uniref:MFS transporter n=1 Tax=Streptomyces sp. NL15-2K TaxID=376149 RepID=UPI000F57D006|nr:MULTISPECIES: MFS transporter [Actinomycetes]WKX05976.1 MFS transporter [Kutzneria buriramensis]WKX15968.1 MFS transporter [Kutzneria buriramensis]WKX16443.1 MFS transporter [Kutzneria buriramensis]GCB53505.1 L-Proline/Glycine betaine transporter proP [Streptomyces sp. NL15-2K]